MEYYLPANVCGNVFRRNIFEMPKKEHNKCAFLYYFL